MIGYLQHGGYGIIRNMMNTIISINNRLAAMQRAVRTASLRMLDWLEKNIG